MQRGKRNGKANMSIPEGAIPRNPGEVNKGFSDLNYVTDDEFYGMLPFINNTKNAVVSNPGLGAGAGNGIRQNNSQAVVPAKKEVFTSPENYVNDDNFNSILKQLAEQNQASGLGAGPGPGKNIVPVPAPAVIPRRKFVMANQAPQQKAQPRKFIGSTSELDERLDEFFTLTPQQQRQFKFGIQVAVGQHSKYTCDDKFDEFAKNLTEKLTQGMPIPALYHQIGFCIASRENDLQSHLDAIGNREPTPQEEKSRRNHLFAINILKDLLSDLHTKHQNKEKVVKIEFRPKPFDFFLSGGKRRNRKTRRRNMKKRKVTRKH